MLIAGYELNQEQRQQVLNSFVYRWTVDNVYRSKAYGVCPICGVDGGSWSEFPKCAMFHPVYRLETDEQWIKRYAFDFDRSGEKLMSKTAHPYYFAEMGIAV